MTIKTMLKKHKAMKVITKKNTRKSGKGPDVHNA